MDDYPAQVDYTFSLTTLQIPYTEGLFIDYRHFDAVSTSFQRGIPVSERFLSLSDWACSPLRVRLWAVLHYLRVQRLDRHWQHYSWTGRLAEWLWSVAGSYVRVGHSKFCGYTLILGQTP